jgi:hypothetical protein
MAAGCIVLMVFLIPLVGFGKLFRSKDDLASLAGAWIAKKEELKGLKIIFNDQIVKFYVDMESQKQIAGNTLLYIDQSDKDFSRLIRNAHDNNAEAIVIRNRRDGMNKVDKLQGYKEIEEFNYKNKFIKIYVSNSVVQNRFF